MRFELGNLTATISVHQMKAENAIFRRDVYVALDKFMACDWGVIEEDDKKLNDRAVEAGVGMILGAYKTCQGEIWIITEADRNATTILFPGER